MPQVSPSDSAEQLSAEMLVLHRIEDRFGGHLEPAVLTVDDGVQVQIDGTNAERSVLVEVFAHIGSLRAGQLRKLVSDAFRLVWVARRVGARHVVIAVVDEPAHRRLTSGRGWHVAALRDFGVQVLLVEVDAAARTAIAEAQSRTAE